MKLLLVAALLLTSASAFAASECGSVAKANYLTTINQFNGGTVSRVDVSNAQLLALQATLACGEISKVQYCYEAPLVTSAIVSGTEAEMKVGGRSAQDMNAAIKASLEVEQACAAQN